MNFRLLALYAVLLGFLALTGYSLTVTEQGFVEWAKDLVAAPATLQVVIDLYIACGLILGWMFYDLKKRGKSILQWWVFVVLTLLGASIGPLLYLIIREHQQSAA